MKPIRKEDFEIYEIREIDHDTLGVNEALNLILPKPEYKRVIPDTWDLNGKGELKGSTSYSTPILVSAIRDITQDASIFPLTQGSVKLINADN